MSAAVIAKGDIVTNGHVQMRVISVHDGWAWVLPLASARAGEGPLTFRESDLHRVSGVTTRAAA